MLLTGDGLWDSKHQILAVQKHRMDGHLGKGTGVVIKTKLEI